LKYRHYTHLTPLQTSLNSAHHQHQLQLQHKFSTAPASAQQQHEISAAAALTQQQHRMFTFYLRAL
jgi:hypothetical protein